MSSANNPLSSVGKLAVTRQAFLSAAMRCSISGEVPQDPVVSEKSGLLYEKRLIDRHISDYGKCPITGDPLTMDDIVAVDTSKGYICFEISEGEYDRKRQLYEKLLDHTKHLEVWISYAKFEASAMDELELSVQNARRVLETALHYFQTSAPELKEERALLLNEWLDMEKSFGELGDISLVNANLPKKLKKRREISSEDGLARYEEYVDYVFPEERNAANFKLLEAALKWKK